MTTTRIHWLYAAALICATPAAASPGASPEAADTSGAASPAAPAEPAEPAGTADDAEDIPIAGQTTVIALPPRRPDRADDSPRTDEAARSLAAPSFTAFVRVRDRDGETTSIGEVVAETTGVHVRSLGGLGGFSSIAVRGADSGHTTVLVDGVPLSRLASVTADLDRLALGSLSEIEIHRGVTPAAYGGAALGGAVNLVTGVGAPASGRRLRLSSGLGSFGARHLRASWRDGDQASPGGHQPAQGYALSAGYRGATGDFSYFNDNGTNLNPGDDAFVRRTNNAFDQADAVARGRMRRGARVVEAGARALWKRQGIPGSASVQSERASLATAQVIADARVEVADFGPAAAPMDGNTASSAADSGRWSGAVSGFAILERQRYQDPLGEIGVGTQDRRYTSASVGGAGQVSREDGRACPACVHRWRADAQLEGRVDYFAEADLLRGAAPRASGTRVALGVVVAGELAAVPDRVTLAPSVRADIAQTRPLAGAMGGVDTGPDGPAEVTPRTDVFASPRLAARVRISDSAAVKAGVGWYFRAPTVFELFGDRGFLVGNPALRAETGPSGDLGVVYAPASARGLFDRVFVEAAVFARAPRDAIALVTTSGLVSVARNLGDARIRGVELGATGRLWRAVTVAGNYAFVSTRQLSPVPSYDGKPLPQRPRHRVYARVEVAVADGLAVTFGRAVGANRWLGSLAVWVDATATSGNFLDPGGVSRVPARQLIGAGVKLEPTPGLVVGLEAKNLADARIETVPLDPAPRPDLAEIPRAIADFFGYPLPGRAVYLAVEWSPRL